MMAEYIHNTLERCEHDVINVKNDIILHGYDADRLYTLVVVETRLDIMRAEFRKIKDIIDVYLLDNK
ncbi:MAG: hypothetical protein IIT39_10690 [Clostridia bacterium]|nr:hypothetical protein [Clostridia bacterium]